MDTFGNNSFIPLHGRDNISDTKTPSVVIGDSGQGGHVESAAKSSYSGKDSVMSATLMPSGKNEPNYRRQNTAKPEKTFTMQSLQTPGQQSEGPRTLPRKVAPTLKDARKLFVGGLPPDITSEEFFNFFQKFGAIADSVVMFDRETRKPRGFGFVTYEDASVCDRLVQMGNENTKSKDLNWMIGRMEMRGKIMEIKRAQPKLPTPPLQHHMLPHMYHHYQMGPYFNTAAPGFYEHQEDGDYAAPQEYGSYGQQHQEPPHDVSTSESNKQLRHHSHYKNLSYTVPPTPPTPSPYCFPVNPSTPVTPQVAFDMAHHMMFYSQLLATPSLMHQHTSMVSPMMASPMMTYGHQSQQYPQYHNAFCSDPIPESAQESELDPPDLQPTLSPKPAATKLSIIVSPARKGKPFSIGGATFFPEAGGGRSPGLPPPLSPNMKHAKPGLPEKKREEMDMGGGPMTPF